MRSEEHKHRISKAFLFIEAHIHEPLSLHQVAKSAFYAPFHFHRVFKEVTGESLNAYISRRRLERCAARLINDPDNSIGEISQTYGFSNTSAFGRAFKKHFGMSPSKFRTQLPSKFSKIRIVEGKNGIPVTQFEPYFRSIDNMIKFIEMNTTIEIRKVTPRHVAYLTHVGLSTQTIGYEKLMRWARPKGYMELPDLVMTSMYLDSAKTTAPEKVRVNIGIVLPEAISEERGIHYMKLDPGKCVVASFVLGLDEFEKAWVSVFVWINEQGYKVGSLPPFEFYYNDYRTHPEQKCIVDIFVPIE